MLNNATTFITALIALVGSLTTLLRLYQHGKRDKAIHEHAEKIHAAIAQDLTKVADVVPIVKASDLETPKIVNGG